MFALTFFGVLHVPINVPALGISTGEDNLNVDRELMAHGVTNALSGFAGSIQVCDPIARAVVNVLTEAELSCLYQQSSLHCKWRVISVGWSDVGRSHCRDYGHWPSNNRLYSYYGRWCLDLLVGH